MERVLGKIYSWTKVLGEHAPEGFLEFAPYVIAIIKLVDGPMITGQLTDLDIDPETGKKIIPPIDSKVEMIMRVLNRGGERGIIVYGYKFRPLIAE